MGMFNFGNNNKNITEKINGSKAVEALAKDIAILANGITGKTPEEIDFESVLGYLELLKNETERVKEGIYAKDNSIYYTSGGEISFNKTTKTR